MRLTGLSRQIAQSMVAMALAVVLLVIFTGYVFYYLWEKYWPQSIPATALFPTAPELAWIIGTTIAGVFLAILVAVNLSRRILAPLNSVTDSIRRVAQGDLSARAIADDESLGEATQLANDFNTLAEKLESMTKEQVFWNAAIAHELRTPVTILRGRLQGLADGVFTPDSEQFRRLLKQVEGLSRLIEDLRIVSLAESGHLDLSFREVDLANEIKSVVDLVAEPFAQGGQHLHLDIQVQHARCDPMRIRQALLVFLENASKHAVPGEIRVRALMDGGVYYLSVSDEGPGITPDFSEHVFTAFRRSPKTRSSGSGLGLAVAAAIAQAHGGQATCSPTSQGGTRFEISWPDQARSGN